MMLEKAFRRLIVLGVVLLPFLICWVLICLGPCVNYTTVGYYDVIDNISSFCVGLGVIFAGIRYSLPYLLYYWFSDELKDENKWNEFNKIKAGLNKGEDSIRSIIYKHKSSKPYWWENVCILSDHIFYEIDPSLFSTSIIKEDFIKLIESFHNLAEHVSINSIMDSPLYENIPERDRRVEILRKNYERISNHISQNSVSIEIRSFIELKVQYK